MNIISSKDVEEEHVIHSKSNNIEYMPYDNANEVVDELFESLLSRYQLALKTSIRFEKKMFQPIALNILYNKEKEICPGYISKTNANWEETKNFLNDSKCINIRLALSWSKKVTCITKRNNFKT